MASPTHMVEMTVEMKHTYYVDADSIEDAAEIAEKFHAGEVRPHVVYFGEGCRVDQVERIREAKS